MAIQNAGTIFPQTVTLIICKAYLVSLLASAYVGFGYTCSDIRRLRDGEEFSKGILAVAIFGAVLISVLQVKYYFDGTVLYSYGPSAMATYFFALLFIVSSFIITFTYGKQMSSHKRAAIRVWMSIEIVAAVIQYFFPKYLLVGFGSSIGLFILYAELENPDSLLDRFTGCFSQETCNMYLSQEFSDLKKFAAIIVCLPIELKLNEEDERAILVEISEFLNSFPASKLFRLQHNDFILIYDSKSGHEMDEIESAVNLDVIRKRFEDTWRGGFHINANYLYVPNGQIASSAEEFMEIYSKNKDKFVINNNFKTIDTEEGENIKDFRQMVIDIKSALQDDRIEVFYQPIYSVATDRFVSAEALARLRNTDGKLIMPAEFIPVAEESGLIEQVGEKVFEKTCTFINEKNLKLMGIDYIEINLSVAQCENPNLHRIYDDIISKTNVNPKEINLEITETSALTQRSVLLENMSKLMNQGIGFALDDFGTGESNLNYIVDMPVNIVKFDKSMVQEYFKNERAKIIMTAAVGMIKQLGLKIVAEGVETEEQVKGIKELGVDFIQGFYFSKPLSENDFVKFIEKNNAA